MGADEVRIEVIAPHAKGQPSLTLWLGKRNGRKGILVAKAVRPWGWGLRILSASVTVLLLRDFASAWRPVREEMHFRIWWRLRRARFFPGRLSRTQLFHGMNEFSGA